MAGDHPVAGLDVGSLQHNVDVLERHLQVAEAADDLSRDDLLCGVPPVAAVHVHLGRLQQAELVVVAKHLHAQVRGPGEVADGQRRVHERSLTLPRWESQTATPLLTFPPWEGRRCSQTVLHRWARLEGWTLAYRLRRGSREQVSEQKKREKE